VFFFFAKTFMKQQLWLQKSSTSNTHNWQSMESKKIESRPLKHGLRLR